MLWKFVMDINSMEKKRIQKLFSIVSTWRLRMDQCEYWWINKIFNVIKSRGIKRSDILFKKHMKINLACNDSLTVLVWKLFALVTIHHRQHESPSNNKFLMMQNKKLFMRLINCIYLRMSSESYKNLNYDDKQFYKKVFRKYLFLHFIMQRCKIVNFCTIH